MSNDDLIRESHYAAHIADDLHLGYFRCSKNGETLEVNATLVKILEVNSEKELIDSGVSSELNRYLLDDAKEKKEKDDKNKDNTFSLKLKSKKGNDIWVELTPRSVNDEHGNIIFHEGFVRDVTSPKSAKEQLNTEMTDLKNLNSQLLSALERSNRFIDELIQNSELSSSVEVANKKITLNKKILIIDDDPKITGAFADFFKEKGMIIQTADNGRDAFNIFQHFQPDVVISDIMMPGMDGLTLQEKIRDLDHDQPIIIVSGQKSKEGAKHILKEMGIPMFLKPVNLSKDLWESVKELLQKSSS